MYAKYVDETLKEEKKIDRSIEGLIDRNRLLSFSDAVFAFAATLLVLKIDLPNISVSQIDTQLPLVFSTLWPQYLANIISFLVIGYYWLNHHVIFTLIKRFDRGIVWLNLIFLLFLSFLPFPVDLYGDFYMSPVVVVFYSASLALIGYLMVGMWWYATAGHRLVSHELSRREINYYMAKLLLAPVIFTLAIPLVYVHPLLTQACWILIIVGIIIIGKIYKSKKVINIEKSSL